MPLFVRKEAAPIDAEQFTSFVSTPRGVRFDVNVPVRETMSGRPYVVTTHGQKTWIEIGDWIVREPDGNGYYPIKDHIFQKTFRPA